ncbi:MAG: sulfatase [Cyclobacteriaceae bacterium]
MRKTNIVFLVLSVIIIGCQHEKNRPLPNVLFILVDDLGYHDLSCTGSDYYETPNVDRIAAEGMQFTNGYAGCQVCSPSRASIMSGKFPARHGITDWIGAIAGEEWREAGRFNKMLPPEYRRQLPSEYTTLPEALKQAGYKTFFAGKWHMGGEGSFPEDHGFDINQGGFHAGSPASGRYYSPFNNPKLTDHEDEKGLSLSMKLAKETVRFIHDNRDSTFFAFLSFYAVHAPIQTTQEKWVKYRQKAEDMGIDETGFKMGRYLPIRQVQDNPVYAGLVETMDDAVGVVLRALDEMHLADNTIVVFTSDNGGVSAGDAFATCNLPLRGGKGYQFEGGLRVPYFIKVPWLDIAGKRSSVPVSGTDFYPTLLELIGADPRPQEHLDGTSLVPLLEGSASEITDRPLIWHYPHYGNQGGEPSSVIRRGEWKLIHYYEDDRKELYNLNEDLEERNDLSRENTALTGQLSAVLFAYLDDVGARFPEHDPEYDAAKERAYLQNIEEERLPQLEQTRRHMLSRDFDPGNEWWGSGDR